MRCLHITLLLVLVGVLAACGGDAAPTTEEQETSAEAVEDIAQVESYRSAVLDDSYEAALPASSQLALGIFHLQGTENAVTPEQARTLLPLWQAIQAGSLQSDAETNAVLKQIEGGMTAEQLAAIAAMQLTREDLEAWMQEQGLNFGPRPVGAGGQGPFADLSEEERVAMRATRQAGGGGGFGQGGFGDLSEEERENIRATAEASGIRFGGRGGPGRGMLAVLAEPVVELLTQLAGE